MSLKSLIQVFILLLIILIIGGVYYNYFDTKKNIVEEENSLAENDDVKLEELEKKILDLELKNIDLKNKLEDKVTAIKNQEDNIKEEKPVDVKRDKDLKLKKDIKTDVKKKQNEKKSIKKKDTKNLVKDVEYTSVDEKGNKFYLLATSGKSNINNNDVLDLDNVRGKITSDVRDTIYIVSDFAQYNSINLNSKFYENVIINYQDKEITCINFDINMNTNKAIAYNNVIVTDPKSVMKAGIVEFDLETKNIIINPETSLDEIEIVTFDGIN